MADASAITLELPERPPMAERYGGLLISVFFHLMILTMARQCILPPVPKEPNIPPPIIHFVLSPPPEPQREALLPVPPPPEIETQISPPPPEVRRTSDIGERPDDTARTATGNSFPDDSLENLAPAENVLTNPFEFDAPEESTEGEILVNDTLQELLNEEMQLTQAEIRSQVIERAEIHGALFQEQEEINSANADFASEGLFDGSVVEIDTTGVAFIIAQRVFQRYGATLERREITPLDAARNQGPMTINAVTLEDGRQLTSSREIQQGPGEVLEYGAEFTAFLHLLQREKLLSLGVNPTHVAITRCVFGFQRDDSVGWSIVITEFEYVEVE